MDAELGREDVVVKLFESIEERLERVSACLAEIAGEYPL